MTPEELEQGALQAQGKAAYERTMKLLFMDEWARNWEDLHLKVQQKWIASVNEGMDAYQQYYIDHGDEV